MTVAGHPRAKGLDGPLPTRDEPGKRLRVVVHLDTPHRLFIRGGEQRGQRFEERPCHQPSGLLLPAAMFARLILCVTRIKRRRGGFSSENFAWLFSVSLK